MKLHEYQSKRVFAQYGVPIPDRDVAATPQEARAVADRLGGKVVVKCQVLVGGRGKAGGIKLADTPDEAEKLAAEILDLEIEHASRWRPERIDWIRFGIRVTTD